MDAEYVITHDPAEPNRWYLRYAWPNPYGGLGVFETEEAAVNEMKNRNRVRLEAEARQNRTQRHYYDKAGNRIEG